MFLKLNELQALHQKWEKLSLDALREEFDALVAEQTNLTAPLTSELLSSIKDFLEIVPMNSGFGVAAAVVSLYDKITSTDTTTDSALKITDIRTIQKIVCDSKPSNIRQMRAVSDILKAMNDTNLQLGSIEERSRIISQIIVRKETEEKTGLQYSEEDNANVRPNENNVPAELHVVKSDKPKPEKKTAKSKKETAK